jgi:hypothetical protein
MGVLQQDSATQEASELLCELKPGMGMGRGLTVIQLYFT